MSETEQLLKGKLSKTKEDEVSAVFKVTVNTSTEAGTTTTFCGESITSKKVMS